MLGWFRATCPCDPEAKRWVEERLRWLSRQFGLHILLERSIILPTDEFFPDAYDGSPKSVRRLFRRVCQYMEVDPEDIEFKLYKDRTSSSLPGFDPTRGFAAGTWQGAEEPDGSDRQRRRGRRIRRAGREAGQADDSAGDQPWQKGIIKIEESILDRVADLIGTMAHELSHQRLLGEGRAEVEAFDNELLTDLTAVYHGFGVFIANNTHKSTGKLHYWPGTKLRRPEYISEPMLGYALAHMAWFRDEDRPKWANALGWVARGVFKQGLRYLQTTADSSFKPVRLRQKGDS